MVSGIGTMPSNIEELVEQRLTALPHDPAYDLRTVTDMRIPHDVPY